MLHTLSRSPWQCDIDGLQRMLCDGDALLLIQDGVLAAIEGSRRRCSVTRRSTCGC
jgi:tRNA 2-thiouridine synthesizing protein B